MTAPADLVEIVARHGGRLVTPEEAVQSIRAGFRVMIPIGSQPLSLADALAAHLATLDHEGGGVEISDCAVAANYLWLEPGFPGVTKVTHEHWGGPVVRRQQRLGQHDYVPIPFALRFKAYREPSRTIAERRPVDAVLVQVSLPNEQGFVSFGPNAWNQYGFVERAPVVLGEISPHIIPAVGDRNLVHVSQFAALVLNESGRRLSPVPPISDEDRAIAGYVAEIVRDGDTLQIGAGHVPTACVYAGTFEGKRDLGWHSEATVSGVIDLIRSGVINGARKTVDPGKAVAAGYAGGPEQMEFLRGNEAILTRPPEYVHNLAIIASQENMVAINAALMVDLTGQIAADSIGHELIGGTGGQLEFAIGALEARNGRSMTVLRAGRGSASAITDTLPPGTIVTVPRLFADIVITEHGVARLFGKTVRERAEELIAIAPPDARSELRAKAKQHFG